MVAPVQAVMAAALVAVVQAEVREAPAEVQGLAGVADQVVPAPVVATAAPVADQAVPVQVVATAALAVDRVVPAPVVVTAAPVADQAAPVQVVVTAVLAVDQAVPVWQAGGRRRLWRWIRWLRLRWW